MLRIYYEANKIKKIMKRTERDIFSIWRGSTVGEVVEGEWIRCFGKKSNIGV